MPIKIRYTNSKAYPLSQKDLFHGRIYEGSDNLLYMATGIKEFSSLIAVGINNDFFIDSSEDNQITFREVDVTITVV